MVFLPIVSWGHDDICHCVNIVYVQVGRHLLEAGTEYVKSLGLWVWIIRYTPLPRVFLKVEL